jgi:preprotein translocase subunit YajC
VIVVVYFVILAGAFFFLIVLPQRRRNQSINTFIASLEVGDEVVTNGGIFGTIVAMESDRVELQIAPGVIITVAKRALSQPAFPVPELAAPDDEVRHDATDDGDDTGPDPDGEQG